MGEQPGAALVVETGGNESNVIPLNRPVIILGKSSLVDIVLDNPYISSRHAQIVLEDGRFHIKDLGSKNGTGINGQPIEREGRWLQNGDHISSASVPAMEHYGYPPS